MNASRALLLLIIMCCQLSGCHAPLRSNHDAVYSQLFLGNFIGLEGLGFAGSVDETRTSENPFAGQQLMMTVLAANSHEARMALRVGEDRSRIWVLTTERDGRLRLRHDHRDPDGTPHHLTDYGGVARTGGTATRQVFPADEFTATLVPEAATNVWTLEFNRERREFIYDLTRHGQPRFRAVFDMSRIAEAPFLER